MAGLTVQTTGVASAAGDPTIPILNSATYVDGGVSLAFTAPTVPSGSTITSYDYEVSLDGGSVDCSGVISTNSYVGVAGNSTATSNPYTVR
jgi:hypothetical protein